MVSAVGAPALPGQVGGSSSIASLQAQLDRYQKQLSDCVNCDTANTREGKQTIQYLSNRISEIKARIEKAAAEKSAPTSALETGKHGTIGATAATSSQSDFAITNLGTRLDAHA
jgi:FlxA-like protein